jgi:hypothetical protein
MLTLSFIADVFQGLTDRQQWVEFSRSGYGEDWRMLVMDRAAGKLIGIVALGDLATKHSSEVNRILSDMSTPSEPDRS